MPEMRKCKECGKMFMPKGREKYCSDVHYRPCPVCGTPVVAKYLSDPPCKCSNCRGRKSQPMNKPKMLFKLDEPNLPKPMDLDKYLAKAQKFDQEAKKVSEEKKQPEEFKQDIANSEVEVIKSGADPEKFCEELDGKVVRYIGPTIAGQHQFVNNHDYKIAMNRKDNTYLLTSSHDLTTGEEVSCFYIFSSQISVGTRFGIVIQ